MFRMKSFVAALTLWLSVATLTGTRLWFVYPDLHLAVSPAFGVWLVTVLHWPKGDVELALALCCSFVATLCFSCWLGHCGGCGVGVSHVAPNPRATTPSA